MVADLFSETLAEQFLTGPDDAASALPLGLKLGVAHDSALLPRPFSTWPWRWELALMALVLFIVLVSLLRSRRALQAVAIGILGGGLLGNVQDWLDDGVIIDFVRVAPDATLALTFNVADLSVATGLVLWVFDLRRVGRRRAASRGSP